jgi:hypothetical protein
MPPVAFAAHGHDVINGLATHTLTPRAFVNSFLAVAHLRRVTTTSSRRVSFGAISFANIFTESVTRRAPRANFVKEVCKEV